MKPEGTLNNNCRRRPALRLKNAPKKDRLASHLRVSACQCFRSFWGVCRTISGGGRFQTGVQIGLFLLMAVFGKAQLYDPAPVPYCNAAYDGPPSYGALESSVTGSNPGGKQVAQFVLEAFAQANANNTLLDSQSQSTTVTALSEIQAMWVPQSQNFKSHYNDTQVADNNSVEFITESLVQISYRFFHLLAQYGPVSQPRTIENLLAIVLAKCQSGSINHHFTIGYTNQWLFRLCNIILTGQGITEGNGNVLLAPDADVVNRGRSDFLTWISTVRNNGLHEFMSPIYTGLDLEALGNIYLYARDPGIAMMAQQGYKLVWIDLYANWYNQNQRMGGTHSRTYEFLSDEDRETDRLYFAASNLITQRSPAWPILLNTRTKGYWRGQDFIAYVLPPPSDVPYLYGPNLALNGSRSILRSILRSFLSDESNYDQDYMCGENYMANPARTGGLSYPFSVGSTESFYNDLTFSGDVVTELSSNGFYTGQVQVTGSGSDIWGKADGFEFYYQTLAGNGTVIGQLTSMPSGSGIDTEAKAGLMMRNDLTPGSANAFIELMGTFGQRFSVRSAANGVSTRSGTGNTSTPYWFKLTWVGNIFTGYSSPDGTTWTQFGAAASISMNNRIYVGIAVTSRNVNNVITTGFDNVGILQQ